MNRFFCFGKRAFCDIAKGERGECDGCEFLDGNGGIHEQEIDAIMRRVYGDEYGIERVPQPVEEDKKRAEAAEARAEKAERALAHMWYAYQNKDDDFPHEYEKEALSQAENILGKWEDVMQNMMKEE